MKLLYVDNQIVDLYPSTVIAQTLQAFDPGRIGSVLTNYTSSLRVPITSNNKRIFRFLENSKSKSTVPYESLSVRYIENGLPIIRNGRIVLTEVNDEYVFNIYSGPWGFFERINTLKLWDLDFSDINGPWTQAARDSYRNATTGMLQALVDDGRLVQDDAASAPTIENQGAVLKMPQIYYHTVLEKIFSSVGFEYEGDIFTDPIYKALAMPLANIYKDPRFLESFQFFAAAPGTQEIVDPVTETNVIFNRNVKQGSAGFYDGVSEYTVVNSETPLAYYRLVFNVSLTLIVTGGTVDIKLEATDNLPQDILNVGSGNHVIQLIHVGLKDADVVKVTIVKNTGTPTVEVTSGLFYSETLSTSLNDEFFPSISQDFVYFQKLFEDINQVDFLREFCVRFGVQITQRDNKLQVRTFNAILDDLTGPDWTQKRHKGLNRIRYTFANYGQVNYLKAPVDTEFTPNMTEAYGDGSFEIPNENLKESQTVYTSLFAVSEMVSTFGVFMLKLNLEPSFAQVKRLPGNRLFFVRDTYSDEPPVLYDAIERTDYKVGYYFDSQQDYEMSWQFFIANFYQKFVDRCLRNVRLIEREYNLSDLDVYQFNQQVPIYDNGERFLVTKISNRVSRRVAKVELLRIESNPSVVYQENRLDITIVDFLETTGDATAVIDFLETVSATIVNQEPVIELELRLTDSLPGNPTWRCTFNSTILNATGSGAIVTDEMAVTGSVTATVVKTANDGFGPTGFPGIFGHVEFLLNGVEVADIPFDSSTHSSLQGLNHTFTGLVAGDSLSVRIFEDGSTP